MCHLLFPDFHLFNFIIIYYLYGTNFMIQIPPTSQTVQIPIPYDNKVIKFFTEQQ